MIAERFGIATTLFGIFTGEWLRLRAGWGPKLAGLMGGGAVAFSLGLLWSVSFPINKNLWTSSYSLLMSGLAAMCLALCLWIVDRKGWRGWSKPFQWLGMNAIALFVLSGLLAKSMGLVRWQDAAGRTLSLQGYVYRNWFEPLASPKNASLLFALAHLAVMFAILWWMHRKRIYLRA